MPRLGSALAAASLALLLVAGHPNTGVAGAQEPDAAPASGLTYQLRAASVQGEITVDGHMDEPDWERAEVATDFVQRSPEPGAPASQRTEVRVLHDGRNLYVGMRMYDHDPEGIVAQLGRRGATGLHSDWAHVIIDSYRDRRTAFGFAVSPAGVQRDVLHYDDTAEDPSWEGVWEAAATLDSLGWTAEFRIPISQLRFTLDDGEAPVWGVNFVRDIAREDERSAWAPLPPDAGRFVSLFGSLHGLDGVASPRRLEVTPYILARLDRDPGDPADPFRASADPSTDLGLDFSYGLGPNLTLTATLNPDFGQVEVDPAVVNLSAFETFFPERRPFFLEGADIFRYPINLGDGGDESLFYTRRIGRTPQGGLPPEAVHADEPSSSRILGAAKLSGRTRSGWSVGLLNAVTREERARWSDGEGGFHESPVEPRTNYAVARVSRTLREGGSSVGGIATAVHRDRSHDRLRFLPSEAYAGGLDARHRFGNDRWELLGWLAGSHVAGSPEAIAELQQAPGRYFQRPDADHVTFDPTRRSLSGWAGDLTVRRVAGRWRGGGILHARSPEFEANDLGFQRDRDMLAAAAWLGRVSFEPGRHLREWNLFTNFYAGVTRGGETLIRGANVNGAFQAHGGWGGSGGVESQLSTLDVVATRGGPALHRPPRSNFWSNLHTDRRRTWFLELSMNGLADHAGTGQRQISVGPTLTARPSPRWEVSMGPRWARNRDPAQYVGERQAGEETHYLFGAIDQTTLSMDTRLNLTFTPDLSLELFAQPFVSVGRYTEFRRVGEPRAPDFHVRHHTFEAGHEIREVDEAQGGTIHRVFPDGADEPAYTFPDPGFRMRSIRGNAVLRWEFRPGSTLYLVWQQHRGTTEPTRSPFRFGRDLRGLTDAPGEHVFVVKASYWIGW